MERRGVARARQTLAPPPGRLVERRDDGNASVVAAMYSLYRAWLMRDAVAAATFATPPDVIMHVGGTTTVDDGTSSPGLPTSRPPHQFAAHRAVIAAHSGYLKALLPSAVGNATTIVVPNISPDVFAPLLTFMYTGYLDVTHDNIYAVLLATHLLHMPRALDLCRSFLVQNQPQSALPPQRPQTMQPSHPSLPTLVKPIPSRKMHPALLGLGNLPPPPPPPPPTVGPFWTPTYHPLPPTRLMLPTADNSPFRTVTSLPNMSHPMDSIKIRESLDKINDRETPMIISGVFDSNRKRSKSPLAVPSTSSSKRGTHVDASTPSPPTSLSPCLSSVTMSSDECNVVSILHNQKKPSKCEQTKKVCILKNSNRKQQNGKNEGNSCYANGNNSKVIIDVACCDGPVRFHRVLNDNYGLAMDEILPSTDIQKKRKKEENMFRMSNEHLSTTLLMHSKHPKLMIAPKISPHISLSEEENEPGSNQVRLPSPKVQDLGLLTDINKDNTEINSISTNHNNDDSPCEIIARVNTPPNELGLPCSSFEKNTVHQEEASESKTNSENSTMSSINSQKMSSSSNDLETMYTCLYCNHTFKSHYCYQKHARRHINPVTIDLNHIADRPNSSNKNVAVCKLVRPEKEKGSSASGGSVRREVRLLDMNVQYYPCKTCGSKFPSYYFVHKHRKLCHANEETESVLSSDDTRSQS